MAQARLSQMHLAIIIEENELGFHRESLWFGTTPDNLGTMITAIMDEWYVDLSNDLNVMFNFVINEICAIFAKDGETPADFPSLAAFKEHFTAKYDLDEDLQNVLETVNEITISKALVQIDMKYNFLDRHFVAASN